MINPFIFIQSWITDLKCRPFVHVVIDNTCCEQTHGFSPMNGVNAIENVKIIRIFSVLSLCIAKQHWRPRGQLYAKVVCHRIIRIQVCRAMLRILYESDTKITMQNFSHSITIKPAWNKIISQVVFKRYFSSLQTILEFEQVIMGVWALSTSTF